MNQLVAALLAQEFYLEGRSKKEIGDELGISRFKVARILEQAVADGIVTITINAPAEIDLDRSRQLAARFGLRQAVVVRPAVDEAGTRRLLGSAGLMLLAEKLSEQDVLGISWGRTLNALTGILRPLARAELVQLVGSVPSLDLDVNPQALISRFAEATGGPVHALHVPMVFDDAELAAQLRRTDHVAATLARYEQVTCALIGIGAWQPDGSSLRDAVPAALRAALDAAGAVADVCSTILDAEGRIVGGSALPDHSIAITTDQLRAVPDVIALAGGADKAPAIRAALTAGLVDRLITDTPAAQLLLR